MRKNSKKIGEVLMWEDKNKRPYGSVIADFNTRKASMTTEVIGFKSGGSGKDAYFYGLHGTTHEKTVGINSSHGCVRFTNADIADLVEETGGKPTVYVSHSSSQNNKQGQAQTHLYKLY